MSDFEQPNNSADLDAEIISKTQLKKDALALKKFGLELSQLSADKISQLPIEDVTKNSLLEYQKIATNLAKKRQLMFVGKCLRNEDQEKIRAFLNQQENSNLKAKVAQDPTQEIVQQLISGGNDAVEQLLSHHPALERQTLRQLTRNVINGKQTNKTAQATKKLTDYIKSNLSMENS